MIKYVFKKIIKFTFFISVILATTAAKTDNKGVRVVVEKKRGAFSDFADILFLHKKNNGRMSRAAIADAIKKVVQIETGGDIRKKNPYTGASGAIQILPKMARRLGLAKNHHLQPLCEQVGNAAKYYVEQLNYFDFPATPADFYLLCFYPSAVNKGFGYKVGGSKVAAQNKILDLNKDGQILKGEIVEYFNSFK